METRQGYDRCVTHVMEDRRLGQQLGILSRQAAAGDRRSTPHPLRMPPPARQLVAQHPLGELVGQRHVAATELSGSTSHLPTVPMRPAKVSAIDMAQWDAPGL
jgi:hypothetical protein